MFGKKRQIAVKDRAYTAGTAVIWNYAAEACTRAGAKAQMNHGLCASPSLCAMPRHGITTTGTK